MQFSSSRIALCDPQGPSQTHVSTGPGQGISTIAARRGKVSQGEAVQICQEEAKEPGEHLLLPAQSWPCHTCPREQQRLREGLAALGDPQLPSSEGER